ncbi:hypothetical protein EMCRGX_G023289 [Ephydatia muelleri]
MGVDTWDGLVGAIRLVLTEALPSEFAIVLEMIDEVKAAQSNVALLHFQLVSISLKHGIRACLETIKPLVSGHLPTRKKRSTAAVSGTLDEAREDNPYRDGRPPAFIV